MAKRSVPGILMGSIIESHISAKSISGNQRLQVQKISKGSGRRESAFIRHFDPLQSPLNTMFFQFKNPVPE